ncbi:uncharacterized protein EV154DRAFT_475713 [Mucor mucedo]|uniref:uncharacterized protein n=1 Tax=Mucor mucedo TaxID=29922 RepID=UPI00221EF12A|nr:uncharacterized protein EV154DRAFT_475713 [Mucor mucedo]KAI7897399.1 hypothetical protein EV154DRAFT_475713 [Mucor mucedo]
MGVRVTVIKKRMDRESRYTARFAVLVEQTQYISQDMLISLDRGTSPNCRTMTNNTNNIVPRLWNHDMTTFLNMFNIVRSLRAGNGIPPPKISTWRRARTQNDQANIRNVRQRRN